MPAPALRVAIAQTNLMVGDIGGNAARVASWAARARDELGADVVLFPELALTGYPPEDLLLRESLYPKVADALEHVAREARGIDVVIGYPHRGAAGIHNACALVRDGEVAARYFKQLLPNYGVFDEKRYFEPGAAACVVPVAGVPVALTICEDVWDPGPMRLAREAGARLMLNVNASPYHAGKAAEREALLAERAREGGMPLVYANLVGGQDELVFDGSSVVVDAGGRVTSRWPAFEEGLFLAEFEHADGVRALPGPLAALPERDESIYRALVVGVRDYVDKNRFRGAVVGLSGGIDSALTLAIAVDALGAGRVEALLMPSRHTAAMSVDDARAEAETLGVRHHVVSIEPVFSTLLESLAGPFAGAPADITEENMQARCRGLMLMAVSNKHGLMVLATGNKSEMAVGYSTLYGDMVGGFAPLKDVAKTTVYRLADWRNRRDARPAIPRRVIERAPSAELAPGQADTDSLPPYEALDAILERYVERDLSPEEIVAEGFERETVERVVTMVIRNEYKRRQAAPGVRVTRRAFGRDRRYPITSAYDR